MISWMMSGALAQSSKTQGMFCIRVEAYVSMRQFPEDNVKAELVGKTQFGSVWQPIAP